MKKTQAAKKSTHKSSAATYEKKKQEKAPDDHTICPGFVYGLKAVPISIAALTRYAFRYGTDGTVCTGYCCITAASAFGIVVVCNIV